MVCQLKHFGRSAAACVCAASLFTGCTAFNKPFSTQSTADLPNERTLEVADLYAKMGNFETAESLYREVLEANPDSQAAAAGLARAAKLQGKPAPDVLQKAIEPAAMLAKTDATSQQAELPVPEPEAAQPQFASVPEVPEADVVVPEEPSVAPVPDEPLVASESDVVTPPVTGLDQLIADTFADESAIDDRELGVDLGANLAAATSPAEPISEPAFAEAPDSDQLVAADSAQDDQVVASDSVPVWAEQDDALRQPLGATDTTMPSDFALPVVARAEPDSQGDVATQSDENPFETSVVDADALERGQSDWLAATNEPAQTAENSPPELVQEVGDASDATALVTAADVEEAVSDDVDNWTTPRSAPRSAASEDVTDQRVAHLTKPAVAFDGDEFDVDEKFVRPIPVPSHELDPLWRVGSTKEPRSAAADLEALLQAETELMANASDVDAWKTVDELLTLSDEATKSLMVTTLGQLPEACRAAVSQRLRTVLATDNTDDLKAAAALALGGLGPQAEPAVPMLKHIVLTGGEQASQAAGVTLECLGHEVPSSAAEDELSW